MKVKKKKSKIIKLPGATTKTSNGDGTITLHHHQEVKQSMNYQSAVCGYGATITVTDDSETVKSSLLYLEVLVERAMKQKLQEQRNALEKLG